MYDVHDAAAVFVLENYLRQTSIMYPAVTAQTLLDELTEAGLVVVRADELEEING